MTEDVTRLIVASIERGEAVRFGDKWLYADAVSELGPDSRVGAYQRLWLGGVMVVSLDRAGEVREQGSARVAYVWLQRTTGRDAAASGAAGLGDSPSSDNAPVTRILFQPEDYIGVRRGLRGYDRGLVQSFYVSNALIDDPKFMTWPELQRLRTSPELIGGVDRRRRELALAIAQRETAEVLRRSLRADGRAVLTDALGQQFVLHASDVRPPNRRERRQNDAAARNDWLYLEPVPGQARVLMDALGPDGRVQRRHMANTAWRRFHRSSAVGFGESAVAPGIAMGIQFNEVSAEAMPADGDPAPPASPGGPDHDDDDEPMPAGTVLEAHHNSHSPTGPRRSSSTNRLQISSARRAQLQNRPEDGAMLGAPLEDLKRRIAALQREVTSKIHERLAMAASCLVMVLLGAVMALRLRDRLPLTIYLWAFFPALATVVTVSAGQQLTHQQGAVGLLLLWGGVVALGGYTLVELRRLARH